MSAVARKAALEAVREVLAELDRSGTSYWKEAERPEHVAWWELAPARESADRSTATP